MSEQNPNQQTAGEHVSHEPCLCREVLDRLHECFDVPPPVCVGKSWIDCTNALTFRRQCDNTWQILELNSSRRFAKQLTIASSACRTRMNEAPRLRLINAFAVPLLGIGFAFPGACAA